MNMESRAEAARAARRADVSMRIELATLELCLERGIDGVTVEEVAAAAGISRRTFYRYFETIEDVLCAMPRRSLKRISAAVSARPSSESVMEAFLQVYRNTQVSDEERAVHRLAFQVAQRSQDAWWHAMHRMQPSAHEIYTEMIAQRLRAEGKSPAPASLLAAVLQAVIRQVAQENVRNGRQMPDPHQLESALVTLAAIMKDVVPTGR